MSEQPTLETTRLRLRSFTQTDAPAVQRLAGEYDIASTTLLIPHPYPGGAAEAWIATQCEKFQRGEEVNFAVTERESGQLVGAIGLALTLPHQRGELGYWIGKPFWGRGYCTEAGRAVLDYAFGPLSLHRVQAYHFVRNPASGRVMTKLGLRHEGSRRDHVWKWDRFEDEELYAILSTDPR